MAGLSQSVERTRSTPLRGHPDEDRTQPHGRIRRTWVRLFAPARYDRLEGSLRIARIEIERRIDPHYDRLEGSLGMPQLEIERGLDLHATEQIFSSLAVGRPLEPGWKAGSLALLTEAEAALVRGKIDQGWKLLHAARCLEVLGMDERL